MRTLRPHTEIAEQGSTEYPTEGSRHRYYLAPKGTHLSRIAPFCLASFCVILLTALSACIVPEGLGFADRQTPGPTFPGLNQCGAGAACTSGLECCRGGCVAVGECKELDPCTVQGAECAIPANAGFEEQGEFLCARLTAGQQDGVCLKLCEDEGGADTCNEGTLCLGVGSGESAFTLCYPSECQVSSQCEEASETGGTCLGLGNGAGFCYGAGNVQEGGECLISPIDADEACTSDTYCVRDEGAYGTCRPLCSFWDETPECPAGQACGFLTIGQGVCMPGVLSPLGAFERCDTVGNWCADGMQCLDFQPGGESFPVCTPYCRPNVPSDCAGLPRQASCTKVFAGSDGQPLEEIGLCL